MLIFECENGLKGVTLKLSSCGLRNSPLKLVLFCLPNISHVRDNTLDNCFIQISSYSPAYVRIIHEKKGANFLETFLGKTKHTS